MRTRPRCSSPVSIRCAPDPTGTALVADGPIDDVLRNFAIAMVRTISQVAGLAFARLVMIDGQDVPELAQAGFANQEEQFVKPLAGYLGSQGFGPKQAYGLATLFIAMAISEWNRSVTFHLPLPDDDAIVAHSHAVTRIFLAGARPE